MRVVSDDETYGDCGAFWRSFGVEVCRDAVSVGPALACAGSIRAGAILSFNEGSWDGTGECE